MKILTWVPMKIHVDSYGDFYLDFLWESAPCENGNSNTHSFLHDFFYKSIHSYMNSYGFPYNLKIFLGLEKISRTKKIYMGANFIYASCMRHICLICLIYGFCPHIHFFRMGSQRKEFFFHPNKF